jgi:L-fuculose-phosphate aldolase
MHTLMYRERPEVGAVVHSHSPYAVVLSVAQRPIPIITIPMAIVVGRRVPVALYCRPGTEELGRSALAAMDGGNATLLGSHGVLAVARNLEAAAEIATVVEDAARIYYMASAVGQPFELPEEEVVYLIDLARRFGRKEA